MLKVYKTTRKNCREINQDRLTSMRFSLDNNCSLWLFMVSDGMGGELDGELYSQQAILSMHNYTAEILYKAELSLIENESEIASDVIYKLIKESIDKLYERINKEAMKEAENNQWGEGGATFSVCWIIENRVIYANVGDSPIYLFRNGIVSELSIRDNKAEERVRNGEIARDSDEYEKDSHMLTGFIGIEAQSIVLHTGETELEHNDVLILGSDGAFGNLNCAELLSEFLCGISTDNAVSVCTSIVNKAAQDTDDNQTLISILYTDKNNNVVNSEKKESIFSKLKGMMNFGRG